MGTVTWLVSSLPQSMMGGLSAVGGVAMGGTAALAGGATAVVGGVVGGVAGLAGGATKTVTQGINLLNPTTMATDIAQVVSGGQGVPGQAISIATNGLNGGANLVGGAAMGIAEGISLIQSGEIEVAQNIAHLLSAEQGAAAGGALVPTVAKDVIQATVGNTNAIASAAIQSVTNPVAAIGATQAAVTESATKLAHALDSVNPLSNLIPNSQVSVLQPQSW